MPTSERNSASAAADRRASGAFELEGRISRTSMIQLDLDSGSTIVAPEEMVLRPSFLPDIGDIIDIFCRITGKCGDKKDDGDGGGGRVCYKTVIGKDGTITITPVPCPSPT